MNEQIVFANNNHLKYAEQISKLIDHATQTRGSGIAKRSTNYIREKITENKAVIALLEQDVIGFCYIESWEKKTFVANSGLIVSPKHRGKKIAKKIKEKAFELSRIIFPTAKLFGLTTSMAVMKINSELGYRAATFAELTSDEAFWEGCKSCNNYDILLRTNRKFCLCNGMLFDIQEQEKNNKKNKIFKLCVG